MIASPLLKIIDFTSALPVPSGFMSELCVVIIMPFTFQLTFPETIMSTYSRRGTDRCCSQSFLLVRNGNPKTPKYWLTFFTFLGV